MFDVLVEVRQEGFKKGEEVFVVRGQVLKLVEVLLDLVTVSQDLELVGLVGRDSPPYAARGPRRPALFPFDQACPP